MIGFSANLGFLWTELSLNDAILAAANAGFDAVECHWPYEVPVSSVNQALAKVGVPMLGLNTVRGDPAKGEFGLAALPDRVADARQVIDQAFDYADQTETGAVHVMAGKADHPEAQRVFLENIRYADAHARSSGRMVLLEPINTHDVPGYFLSTVEQGVELVNASGCDNVRLMFDCYHVARMGHDVFGLIERHHDLIGHVQIASVPDRCEPDHGSLDYSDVIRALRDVNYSGYVGAEYRPSGRVEDGLDWLSQLRTAA